MEFETGDGLCAVVDAAQAGGRLQRFVARAFRERLGQKAGMLHVGARHEAALACDTGRVLVDGVVAAGRLVLRGGEVVTLRAGADDPAESPHGLALGKRSKGADGPPRMVLVDAREGHQSSAEALWATPGAAAFRRFYRDEQRICGVEEWAQCEPLFASPVPLSLRVNRSTPLCRLAAQALRAALRDRIEHMPWMEASGGALHAAPAASAEEAAAGLDLVKALAAAGEVVVQEGASMLPALALAPRPGDAVLDLCSAPGSKTCQLLDAMAAAAAPCGALPSGLLVANELCPERAARLWSRAKWQPCAHLLVTVADASSFPALCSGFDRILADVPCSSDGTVRKERKRLERWSVHSALRHHGLQLSILRRALELLRPGGRLVYSTCSLNPLEDEAVVRSALLIANAGAHEHCEFALVPAEEALPAGCPRGLPGLETWRVPDPAFETSGLTFASPQELPEALRAELPESLFPGSPNEAHRLGLCRCARLLPTSGSHLGGFFLAVIARRPAEGEGAARASRLVEESAEPPPLLRPLQQGDQVSLAGIAEFLGLGASARERLVVLEEGAVIALASPGLAALRRPAAETWSLLRAGLPLLRRAPAAAPGAAADGPGGWQLCPEGASSLAALASRRRLRLPRAPLLRLLRERESSDGLREALAACGCEACGPVLVLVPHGGTGTDVWLAGAVAASSCEGGAKVSLLAPSEVLLWHLHALEGGLQAAEAG